jgi:hypothetical protein
MNNISIPFGLHEQLNHQLKIVHHAQRPNSIALARTEETVSNTLPGNPFVPLSVSDVIDHLQATLLTRDLDVFAPYLWLVSTQSSFSITPLHRQVVLARNIIVTQAADLHAIWYYDRVFLKPLPPYLLSHAFWEFIFGEPLEGDSKANNERQELYRAAIGFIRTYCHLIKDEFDFNIAMRHHLIPEGTTSESFAAFINNFKTINDDSANARFRYGELRLSRLNFWAPLFLHRMEYFNPTRQASLYFSAYFQPLLFVFGSLSVLLSAMQVALATDQSGTGLIRAWARFIAACQWVSVVSIVLVAAATGFLLLLLCFKTINEWIFATRALWRSRLRSRKSVTGAKV